jgi:hypothetical protein
VSRRTGFAAIALVLLAGCAGTRPYVNDAPANVTVRTELDRGVRATLHVHAVGADCRTEYRGSLRLDRPTEELALPPGAVAYLVVSFDTSSFLGGARSISAGALLEPRPGRRYEISAAYRDSQYDVALKEAGAPGRVLPRRDLAACVAR